jgi:branched-chain amino acid transport system permease protein
MKAGAAVGRRAGITGKRWVFISTLAIMGLLLFVPSFHNDYINLTFRNILMYAAMSYGWNLIGGYTGYVSFGNVAFFGIGAYCSAVLSKTGIDNVFADVGLALVMCALFAIVVGLPILRLRGHYFGIATLGVALGLTDLANNLDFVGGSGGLNLKQADQAHFYLYYYAMWAVTLVCMLATFFIARSKLGYAFVAIRENEEAAQVLGISPTRYKVIAWALGGMMGGAAGAVFAPANGFVDPGTAFAVDNNVFPIAMAILGGMGTASGPFIGALLLSGVNEILQEKFLWLHSLFFGAIIVLIVVFLPRGLMYLVGLRGGVRRWLSDLRAFRV